MKKELTLGIGALTGLLSFAQSEAGPINGYPIASTPLNGQEQLIGTQSATTVQVYTQDIANLTHSGNITYPGNITVTNALVVNGVTTLGNVTIGNVTGALEVTGNLSGGNLSTAGNITDTGLGNCTGGINAASGVLSCTAPTWASGTTGGNDTAPNSIAAYHMMGLVGPGNATFTPTRSGTVLITACGTVTDPGGNTTAGTGINLQLSYGTGGAPANNANLTGTQTGAVLVLKSPTTITAADIDVPVCSTAVANLTISTAYWIDYAAEAIGAASQYTITNTYVSVIEQ